MLLLRYIRIIIDKSIVIRKILTDKILVLNLLIVKQNEVVWGRFPSLKKE